MGIVEKVDLVDVSPVGFEDEQEAERSRRKVRSLQDRVFSKQLHIRQAQISCIFIFGVNNQKRQKVTIYNGFIKYQICRKKSRERCVRLPIY